MCRFSVEESSQLQGAVPSLFAQKERQCMAQDLPEHSARQVPEVPRAHRRLIV